MNKYPKKDKIGLPPLVDQPVQPRMRSVAIIKQTARCYHSERLLPLPENTFFLN